MNQDEALEVFLRSPLTEALRKGHPKEVFTVAVWRRNKNSGRITAWVICQKGLTSPVAEVNRETGILTLPTCEWEY